MLALGAAFLVAACDQPTDPIARPQRRLLVHAVLDAGTGLQHVKVQYLDAGAAHTVMNVPGAVVTIVTPSGATFAAQEIANGAEYQIVGMAGANVMLPSGTYTLQIVTPAGEVVSGTTTMPTIESLPEAEFLVQPFIRERDTLRIQWKRIPNAARYEVAVEAFFVQHGISFQTLYTTFADTSIVLAGTARTLTNDAVFGGESVRIVVSAVDENYYTYYHASVDPFAGAPPSRLTGALGVFGAIAPVVNRTYQNIR